MANAASYRAWLESHTPAQLRNANSARRALRRLGKKYPLLKDDRLVKQPLSSFFCFRRERVESGDLKHMSFAEQTDQVKSEWRSLTEAEKEVSSPCWKSAALNSIVNVFPHSATRTCIVRRFCDTSESASRYMAKKVLLSNWSARRKKSLTKHFLDSFHPFVVRGST